MQFSRSFGATDRTRQAAQSHAADPQKKAQWLQYQSQQQTQSVLAKVPRGSRVFNRNRDLEKTVQQREEAARQRQAEAEAAKQNPAQRMTRSFRGRIDPQSQAEFVQQMEMQRTIERQQQVGRTFGASRGQSQSQPLSELETPWHWEGEQVQDTNEWSDWA